MKKLSSGDFHRICVDECFLWSDACENKVVTTLYYKTPVIVIEQKQYEHLRTVSEQARVLTPFGTGYVYVSYLG